MSNSKIGIRTGELNNKWKGEDVGYSGLHKWIRGYLPKPEFCHLCRTNKPKEVACITGVYNRELKNWAWFCVKCHKLFDNIIERNLRSRQLNKAKIDHTN